MNDHDLAEFEAKVDDTIYSLAKKGGVKFTSPSWGVRLEALGKYIKNHRNDDVQNLKRLEATIKLKCDIVAETDRRIKGERGLIDLNANNLRTLATSKWPMISDLQKRLGSSSPFEVAAKVLSEGDQTNKIKYLSGYNNAVGNYLDRLHQYVIAYAPRARHSDRAIYDAACGRYNGAQIEMRHKRDELLKDLIEKGFIDPVYSVQEPSDPSASVNPAGDKISQAASD